MNVHKSLFTIFALLVTAVLFTGCSQGPAQPAVNSQSFGSTQKPPTYADAMKRMQQYMATHPINTNNPVKPKPQPAGFPQ